VSCPLIRLISSTAALATVFKPFFGEFEAGFELELIDA